MRKNDGKKKKGLFDLQVDFFLPMWRRIAVVVVCTVWAMVEFFSGSMLWGIVFCAIAGGAVQQFFFDGWPE